MTPDEELSKEVDRLFAGAATYKLERQLQNNEPKCANCRNWDHSMHLSTVGACVLIVKMASSQGPLNEALTAIALAGAMTTDLTVCSRWEQK